MSEPNKGSFSTLQMIADELGLSVSTVSRVLNSSAETARSAASTETATRIRALAGQLGYSPNPHARSLRSSSSGEIGVLVPRVSDLVLANIYEGIQVEAAEHGLQSFVASTYDDPDLHRSALASMLERRVDGVIVADSRLDDRAVDLEAYSVPIVAVSRRAWRIPSVTCDDRRGGASVAEHFLAQGHERVAVVAGQPYASTGIDRTRGFCEVFEAAGLALEHERIQHSSFDVAGGRQAINALGDDLDDLTAIFAVNDFTAIGVMGALRDRGLRPGRDVAIAGFNDISLASDLPVSLTTVRSPMAEMGKKALQLLIRAIAGERVRSRKLAPALQERESSGTEAAEMARRNSPSSRRSSRG